MTRIARPEFGTDGLRGRAGDPPLDPDTLVRIGASLGLWLQRQGPENKRVLIGNDGRASSYWILESLAQGLASVDASSSDLGLTTTPALAWLTQDGAFDAGIMISASHNPAVDNGIKIFAGDGSKLSDDAQDEIATLAPQLDIGDGIRPRPREQAELAVRYQEYLANKFADLSLDGVKVVLDAANGGGSALALSTLTAFGADVVALCCEPDGHNINDGCGALHPDKAAAAVKEHGAALGICLDGDGDRGIFVDSAGQVRDGDDVLLTLGTRLRTEDRLPESTVVTTVMSNLGMHKKLRENGIEIAITPVGDRHVTKRMKEHGYVLGAETSGHVVFGDDGLLIGDGLLTALHLLSLPGVVENGSAGSFVDFQRFPQLLLNVPVEAKPPLEDVEAVMECQRAIEADLGEDGRVVLRYSGTENLCRVMVEGPVLETVEAHAEKLATVVRDSLR